MPHDIRVGSKRGNGAADKLGRFRITEVENRWQARWPLTRLVEIWNSLPGQTPVKKFQDRKLAITRVWKAIQPLAGKELAESAAEKLKATRKTRKAAKKVKAAKKAVPAKQAAVEQGSERSNKKAGVLAMMSRAEGATLAEIMQATGWQKHTVRGFVSILGSKGGHAIESSKNAAGERTYRTAK